MFQRRRVEYEFGPDLLEYRTDTRLIADIGDQRLTPDVGMCLRQFHIDLPERELAVARDQNAELRETLRTQAKG